MITRFFCFPDTNTSLALAQVEGMLSPQGNFVPYSHEWAVDVVGVITPTAVIDENGTVIESFPPLPGWHVNVRTSREIPAELLPFEVFPETPCRDFA